MEIMEISKAYNGIFQGKKVVITGNTGFKGSWLSLWMHTLGAEVIGISHEEDTTEPSLFQLLDLKKRMEFIKTDINQFETLKVILLGIQPDFIFHLAAQAIVSTSYKDSLGTLQTNIMGTANVLECLKYFTKPCVAIMVTSDKCYHNQEWLWGYRESDPIGGKDPYSASKGAADIVIQSYVYSFFSSEKKYIKIATARAGNVIGGGDFSLNRIVPDCFRAWFQKKSVKIRNPESVRPWQHVLESLSGYLNTAQYLFEERINSGECYNFGPSVEQSCTVINLVRELSSFYTNGKIEIAIDIDDSNNFKEAGTLRLNWDKAYYQLNWKPVLNFFQTIQFTAEWYKFYEEKKGREMFDFTLEQIKRYQFIDKAEANHTI